MRSGGRRRFSRRRGQQNSGGNLHLKTCVPLCAAGNMRGGNRSFLILCKMMGSATCPRGKTAVIFLFISAFSTLFQPYRCAPQLPGAARLSRAFGGWRLCALCQNPCTRQRAVCQVSSTLSADFCDIHGVLRGTADAPASGRSGRGGA